MPDVIIVGAGSAGNILAARLSEDLARQVLLLEAGPDYPRLSELPDDIRLGYGTPAGILSLSHDWGYRGRATDRVTDLPIPRGRLVGGSSAVNAQVYLRGIPEDFEAWTALGLEGWTFEDVLPYYNRVERDVDFGEAPYHGGGGPIGVQRDPPERWGADQRAWYQAARDAGHPHCADANQPGSTGVGPFPLNNIDGIRQSTALTYLAAARHRPNLKIRPNSRTRRLIFSGLRVIGVELDDGERILGDRVILTAGAIGSPQILMLSGIGPVGALENLGIPVALERPGVGNNLRDHPTTNLRWALAEGRTIDDRHHWHQVGLRYTAPDSERVNDMVVYAGANPYLRLFFARPTVNLALSSGRLDLTGPDIDDRPRLAYDFFSHPEDLRRQRDGIRRVIEMVEEHPLFRPLLGTNVLGPGDSLDDDRELDEWILANADTGHHTSSTCRMGLESDPGAVVDSGGRVFGCDGLRVVDASIMPDSVRANINATVMMIAEKIADELVGA